MLNRVIPVMSCAMLALICLACKEEKPSPPAGSGGHSHAHPHTHAATADFKMPGDYRGAVHEIDHRMEEIEELMKSNRLAEVHPQAEVIQKVGNIIGQLAAKPDSGVPREAVKEVNATGKELAAKFDPIDRAADSGDAAGTRKVYDDMVKLAEVLRKHVPQTFACPMRCEGDKTYPAPGKCPICGMALSELQAHADHEPKHGGIFFMAPDHKHHLEGTLSADGEFRIYFYNEFTRPISAEKFAAEAKYWPRGADETARQPLALAPLAGKTILAGRVPIKPPLSIKVFIDFKDGERPQVFDFDFAAPSKAHTENAPRGEH